VYQDAVEHKLAMFEPSRMIAYKKTLNLLLDAVISEFLLNTALSQAAVARLNTNWYSIGRKITPSAVKSL
jgi:hypothetical protein